MAACRFFRHLQCSSPNRDKGYRRVHLRAACALQLGIESQIMSGLPQNFRSELPWLRNQVSTMRQAMDSMLRRLSRLTAESQAGYTLRAALRVAAMPRFRNFASCSTRRLTPIGRQKNQNIYHHMIVIHFTETGWMDAWDGWMDG